MTPSLSVIARTALDVVVFDCTTGFRMLLLCARVSDCEVRAGWMGVSGGVSGPSILTGSVYMRSICSSRSFSDCCTIAAASINDGCKRDLRDAPARA